MRGSKCLWPKKQKTGEKPNRLVNGPIRVSYAGLNMQRSAQQLPGRVDPRNSDFGGLVGSDFHADADFNDHRGGPGHSVSSSWNY
jgi:hypothetical protein